VNISEIQNKLRSRLLQKACASVSREVQKGRSVRSAITKVSRRYAGRRLGERKWLHCSEGSLERIWFRWRKAGCTPEAFRLHYRPGRKIDARRVAALIRAALAANVSLSKIYRQRGGEKKLRFSLQGFYRRVDPRMVKFASLFERLSKIKFMITSELDGFVTSEARSNKRRRIR
jgi:hypothetical protein